MNKTGGVKMAERKINGVVKQGLELGPTIAFS